MHHVQLYVDVEMVPVEDFTVRLVYQSVEGGIAFYECASRDLGGQGFEVRYEHAEKVLDEMGLLLVDLDLVGQKYRDFEIVQILFVVCDQIFLVIDQFYQMWVLGFQFQRFVVCSITDDRKFGWEFCAQEYSCWGMIFILEFFDDFNVNPAVI